MASRKLLQLLGPVLVIILFFSLFLGQLLGQPILLAFVETGSMAPTLEPGDGFIAIPMSLAGPIETGDVITFEAKVLHGGGLVTHRVVGKTPDGFITQGDANPVTDQAGSEPPVKKSQIKAKALQLGGSIVVIPKIGLVVIAVNKVLTSLSQALTIVFGESGFGSQQLAYLLFGIGILSFIGFTFFGQEESRDRSRETSRSSDIVNTGLISAGLTLLLVILITTSMLVPSGPRQFEFVSAETDAPGPKVIERGTTEKVTYTVPSYSLLPAIVFLEPQTAGIKVRPQQVYVPGNQKKAVEISLQASESTGPNTRSLIEHRYIGIVPTSTIRALYEIHPWLPILYIDSIFGIGFEALAIVLIGSGKRRMRSRSVSRS